MVADAGAATHFTCSPLAPSPANAPPVAQRVGLVACRRGGAGGAAQGLGGRVVLRQHLVVLLARRRRIAGGQHQVGELDAVALVSAVAHQRGVDIARQRGSLLAVTRVALPRPVGELAAEAREGLPAIGIGRSREVDVEVVLGVGELAERDASLEPGVDHLGEEVA